MASIMKFVPPQGTTSETDPFSLFGSQLSPKGEGMRFVSYSDPGQMLIFTDGTCGRGKPRAGCGFIYRPKSLPPVHDFLVAFRLEECTLGKLSSQTSNRAELRAVIGALQFRKWEKEGFHQLVIAYDSTYVLQGLSEWLPKWENNGGRSAKGDDKNQDLWIMLIEEVRAASARGLEVRFWPILRKWNRLADEAADIGADMEIVMEFRNGAGREYRKATVV